MRKATLILILIFAFQWAIGNDVDSLFSELEKNPTDLQKIDLFNNLSVEIQNDRDTSLFYANKALALSEKINHPQQIINSYLSISNLHQDMGNYEKAIDILFKAQIVADSIGHSELLGKVYNNLGNAYRGIGDIESAEEFCKRAIELYTEINNELELGKAYNNIGLIYVRQDKFDDAINSYNTSIAIVSKFNDKTAIANGLSNLGVAYYYKGEIDKTIQYFEESLKIERELDNQLGVAISMSNIGELYLEMSNYPKAIEYLLSSIETSKKVNAQDLLKHSYLITSQVYAKTKKYETAYEYHQLYTSLKDSINDVEKSKHAIELETKFATSEKEKKILELEHLKTTQELELAEKKQTQYFLIAGVVIVILLLLVFYIRYRSSNKAKELLQIYNNEIEEKNAEITESITYAKRIQEAILPSDQLIEDCLPDSFVLYKPKDIVAGDFYWIDVREENILFAVADCTGHGVPGAMVSVVCHNAMDRAIREYNLITPGEILDKTREIVVEQLNKSKSSEIDTISNIRDGMDIALCSLNTKTNELYYSGAYNPLWIIREGSNEIEEVKANRQSIGKVDDPNSFKTHKINLSKGDSIYIFSDGYADQFGGEKEKKYKSANLKKLLLSFHSKPMEDQKVAIDKAFEDWKGNLDQVDDVCLIGVRI